MFRYIALVWNVSSEQQSRAAESLDGRLRARRWMSSFTVAGLKVFCVDASATLPVLPLANDAGVVLGAIFERSRDIEDDSPARRAARSACSCEAILASRGQWLIDNCWGNYVALMRDSANGMVRVLKDPTGTLPCFRTSADGVIVLFAHVGDCVELGLRQFTVDRSYLRARVLGFNDLERNSLAEVSQIRRGECIEIDPAAQPVVRSSRFYWDPFAFVREQQAIEDPDRAAAAVNATVRSCTQALSDGHSSVLHR
ncbi:MAG TPA: hypothetical protein VJ299_18605, partial [Steroidobacteraceae bacterium]|nr:hypothetical protein [Steroidobacteraceae bacterium]